MTPAPILWLLALIAGALIPVQAAANAALTLFAVAGAATALVLVLAGNPAPKLTVAFYVLTITFLAPRIGIGTAITLIVTGQILAALAIDQFGLLRSLVFHLTPARAAGALLMIGGAFLALRPLTARQRSLPRPRHSCQDRSRKLGLLLSGAPGGRGVQGRAGGQAQRGAGGAVRVIFLGERPAFSDWVG